MIRFLSALLTMATLTLMLLLAAIYGTHQGGASSHAKGTQIKIVIGREISA